MVPLRALVNLGYFTLDVYRSQGRIALAKPRHAAAKWWQERYVQNPTEGMP
jgi:hypothetical protein